MSRNIVVFAPAKINLGLRITGRYASGYHRLEGAFLSVSLFDRVEIRKAAQMSVRYVWPTTLPVGARRSALLGIQKAPLLWKSIAMVRDYIVNNAEGITISNNLINEGIVIPPIEIIVNKGVPSPSGLGGASSDAAVLIATLWKIATGNAPLPSALIDASENLGADIPFFLRYGLYGKAAYLDGVGHELTEVIVCGHFDKLSDREKMLSVRESVYTQNSVVEPVEMPESMSRRLSGFLCVPSFGFPTAQMFATVRTWPLPLVQPSPHAVDSYPSNSKRALRLNEIPYSDEPLTGIRLLQNDFEKAAAVVFPQAHAALQRAQRFMAYTVRQRCGGLWWGGMSGSGAGLYMVTDNDLSPSGMSWIRNVLQVRLGRTWRVFSIYAGL
ncbi:MAG TPA: hypothetical protein PLY93_07590 [Turneriella sp.]|nr:hypothetical protein [Turneriella sp.]